MVKGLELTAEERNTILTLRSAGLTVRGIAEATKRSVGVCSKVLSAQSKPKKSSCRGTKPKTSERDRRHIIRLVSDGDLSAVKVKAKLKLVCSVRNIQRALKPVDWLSYKKHPAEPAMMKRHKAARVTWKSEKALRGDIDWRCVVFSDEKKWNLGGPAAHSTSGQTRGAPPNPTSVGTQVVARSWCGRDFLASPRRS